MKPFNNLIWPRPPLPEDYTLDFVTIADEKMGAYEGKGDFRQALTQAKEYIELEAKARKERDENDADKKTLRDESESRRRENKRLQSELEVKKVEAREAEVIKKFAIGLGLLSFGLIFLMILTIRSSHQVKLQKRKIEHILDTVEEGLVVINRDLKIEDGYSAHLPEIIGQNPKEDLSGRDVNCIFEDSNLSHDQISYVREILKASIGEDEINWFANAASLLPKAILFKSLQGRRFAIRWAPSLNQNEVVENILVSVHEVTDLNELKDQWKAAEKKASRIESRWLSICKGQGQKIKNLLFDLEKDIENWQVEKLDKSCMKDLHTYKGNARTLGLELISDLIHSLETNIEKSAESQELLKDLQSECHEHKDIIQLIGDDSRTRAMSSVVLVCFSDLYKAHLRS